MIQNVLKRDLPRQFTDPLPQGVAIAYAVIPTIRGLEDPLKDEVRHAFARALQAVWYVMIGVSGAGVLSCLFMREIELRTDMDEEWAIQAPEKDPAASLESGGEGDEGGK